MRALDLFCGGGGAALGMIQAGFDVTGVDINARNAEVYPGYFIHADALEMPKDFIAQFDLVWASPPCQAHSVTAHCRPDYEWPNLIPQTRQLLEGHPRSVIENVPGAPIRQDVVLTGPQVGLPEILRKRVFETSWFPGLQPPPQRNTGSITTVAGHMFSATEGRRVMGIELAMTRRQLAEAVPPAYAHWIAQRAC